MALFRTLLASALVLTASLTFTHQPLSAQARMAFVKIENDCSRPIRFLIRTNTGYGSDGGKYKYKYETQGWFYLSANSETIVKNGSTPIRTMMNRLFMVYGEANDGSPGHWDWKSSRDMTDTFRFEGKDYLFLRVNPKLESDSSHKWIFRC
ncbi:MAG: hypothetical protein AAF687_04905 [Pseudomonadota bacterium]